MFIPDALKVDVVKFYDSAAGKALLAALRERRPNAPDAHTPYAHTLLDAYAEQKGYEKCLDAILRIPHESAEQEKPEDKERVLLDPRD